MGTTVQLIAVTLSPICELSLMYINQSKFGVSLLVGFHVRQNINGYIIVGYQVDTNSGGANTANDKQRVHTINAFTQK